MIFINFKTYKQGTGQAAFELAKTCQKVAKKTAVEIFPLVQATDIFNLAHQGLKVWAQHVDNISFGPHTGQVLPQAVTDAGAEGVLLNHSEHKLPVEVVKETLKRCQVLGLKTLVCSDSLEEAKAIAEAKPDLIAYEPPEFVGSRTDSVSTAKPEVIKDFVNEIKKIPVLVGAGIHSRKDVRIALQLGAKGILVATDVVLAEEPEKQLLELAGGLR